MNVQRERGRDVQERKKRGWRGREKRDGDARAIRCQGKESEFPFSRRSTEGIGPRAGSSYDRISHWRARRSPAVDTSCHLSRLTTAGRSRSISDIPPGISNPLCRRLFFVDENVIYSARRRQENSIAASRDPSARDSKLKSPILTVGPHVARPSKISSFKSGTWDLEARRMGCRLRSAR